MVQGFGVYALVKSQDLTSLDRPFLHGGSARMKSCFISRGSSGDSGWRVAWMSAAPGDRSPEEWLWATTRAVAPASLAPRKTSCESTRVDVAVPGVMRCRSMGDSCGQDRPSPDRSYDSGLSDTPNGWAAYVRHLIERHAAEEGLPIEERESFSAGWAIGADEWKNALLERAAQGANPASKAEYQVPKEIQRLRWEARLAEFLAEGGLSLADLNHGPKHAGWKVQLADRLQREMGVPVVWLAVALNWGRPAALRTRLCRFRKNVTM